MLENYHARHLAYFLVPNTQLFFQVTSFEQNQITDILDASLPIFPNATKIDELQLNKQFVLEIMQLFEILKSQNELSMSLKIKECEQRIKRNSAKIFEDYPIVISDDDAKKWLNLSSWKAEEAAFYSLGLSCDQGLIGIADAISTTRPRTIILRDLSHRLRTLRRAVDDGALKEREKPSTFVRYFKRLDMNVPDSIGDVALKQEKVQTGQLTATTSDKREILSLAKLLTAIAIEEYGYSPDAKRSPIPNEIENISAKFGIRVSSDTIRKYLMLGAKQLPKDWKNNR